ncbi:MAG: HNH endonuclease [Oscillospiraceae bacterium]|nr:HNH endonuclease [Oscillospiraceae bacterium]
MWKTKNGSVICSAITYESNDNIISSFLNMRQNLFSTTQYPFLQENLILEFLDEKKFRFNRKADDEDHFILIYYDEEHKESDSIRSYDDLLRKAIAYSAPGSFRSHYTSSFTRNRYVSDFAKLRANGFCQLCGQEAPFLDRNEIPYLETHHIISLADGGEDSIDNTVALCPNCHRKMHSADPDLLTEDIKKLLSIASLY